MKTIKGTWANKQRLAINAAHGKDISYDVYKEGTTMSAYKNQWFKETVINKVFELIAGGEVGGKFIDFQQLWGSIGVDRDDLVELVKELEDAGAIIVTYIHKEPYKMWLKDNDLRRCYRLAYRAA